MNYLRKLPFILGASMTIIVGAVSYCSNFSQKNIYLRMAVSMTVFYLVGVLLKSVIEKTYEEAKVQKKLQEEEEKKRKKEEEKSREKGSHSRLDYVVGEDDGEFSPLKVSKVIKKEIAEYGKDD